MKLLFTIVATLFVFSFGHAQLPQNGYFNMSSPLAKDAKDYGVITVDARGTTTVIQTVMASGENVKGLTIRINNGFAFKLAPSQNGTTLNYVGSSLNIVLQPYEKATIEFIDASKVAGAKQLYVSGQVKEK